MKKEGFKEKLAQYALFAGPGMIIFLLVVAIPIFYGVYLTFTDWDGIARVKNFIGFENYVALFEDTEFWHSLYLTIKYVFISTILINILAFFLAYELTSGVKGQNFLRAGFFTPNLIGGIILGFIWKFIFQRVTVQMYDVIPLEILKKSWLSSPDTAFAALVIVTVWQYAGYMLLIYIAGFVSIPKDYDLNISLTEGGPYNSTKLVAMHIYTKAFEEHRYGIGQAEAIVLFIIMAVIALTQVYIGKKREVEA